jgi:hypothetical protein
MCRSFIHSYYVRGAVSPKPGAADYVPPCKETYVQKVVELGLIATEVKHHRFFRVDAYTIEGPSAPEDPPTLLRSSVGLSQCRERSGDRDGVPVEFAEEELGGIPLGEQEPLARYPEFRRERERENFTRNFPQRGPGERYPDPQGWGTCRPGRDKGKLHILFDDCYSTHQSKLSRGLT